MSKNLAACLAIAALFAAGAVGVHVVDGSAEKVHVMQTDEPLAQASVAQIGASSDLIVVGEIDEIRDGIVIAEGLQPYSLLSIKVAQTVKGTAPAELKVLMLRRALDGALVRMTGRADVDLGDRAVWMLRAVDPMFGRAANEYVLTSNSGVVPLGRLDQVSFTVVEPTPALAEAQQLGNLDRLLAALRSRPTSANGGSEGTAQAVTPSQG